MYVKQLSESEYRRIPVFANQTIGSLRRIISETYKRPLETINLIIGNIRYDSFDDDTLLSNVKGQIVTVDLVASIKDDITPKSYLASHPRIHNLLF